MFYHQNVLKNLAIFVIFKLLNKTLNFQSWVPKIKKSLILYYFNEVL